MKTHAKTEAANRQARLEAARRKIDTEETQEATPKAKPTTQAEGKQP